MSFLVAQILLFIRNATIDLRQTKVYFLKNEEFLPQLLTFLSHGNMHPRLRAYSAAVLWSLVHGHQGIKAAINKPAVLTELQQMRQEYASKVTKASALGTAARLSTGEGHARYDLADHAVRAEQVELMTVDMDGFTAKALDGILTLTQ